MNVLERGIVRVGWSELGEGLCGEYDPDDPEDVELLRFDVSVLLGDEWIDPGDVSYCTLIPASAGEGVRARGLRYIMDEIYEAVCSGHSAKKLCERLSWMDPSWLEERR
jgi:hypothetical protein